MRPSIKSMNQAHRLRTRAFIAVLRAGLRSELLNITRFHRKTTTSTNLV